MCPLTKEQRLAAYEYALEGMLTLDSQTVCDLLREYTVNEAKDMTWTDWYYKEVPTNYPEFFAQKPVYADTTSFWWSDKHSRIKALKAAIELTKST